MVKAGYTKNREEAVLPLKPEIAALLKEYFTGKLPHAQAFKLPNTKKRCESAMIKADLQEAGIDPADNGRGKLDFHALRHTFGTLLAASGVHPKTAQDLMRHSDINLTMTRYTHTLRGQQAAAIDSLPDFTAKSEAEQTRKTGTDGATELFEKTKNYLSFYLSILGRKHRNSLDNTGQKSENVNCLEQGQKCDKMPLYAKRPNHASVAELADALDLGSSTERYGGSTPLARSSRV